MEEKIIYNFIQCKLLGKLQIILIAQKSNNAIGQVPSISLTCTIPLMLSMVGRFVPIFLWNLHVLALK